MKSEMSLEQTLDQIEHDIQTGDLGKARDRLHGLIVNYPDNLELRKQLGQVYWQLQMPEMAGRYWYLEEHKTEPMLTACKRFEAQFGNDPALILFAIKFKGNVDAIKDTYPGKSLLGLDFRAREKHWWYVVFRKRGSKKFLQRTNRDSREDSIRASVIKWGCIVVVIFVILLFLVGVIDGIVTAAKWLT